MSAAREGIHVEAARHARAIALLPFMNTVVIPSALLVLYPPALPSHWNAAALLALAGGAALAAGGAALVIHSIALFVRHGCGTLAPWDPTRQLVSLGAYRYTRNPMKGGLFLVLAGEALMARSPALALWFAVFVIANAVYIRLHEEPGLHRRFGEGYREYCARVPRWCPTLRTYRTQTEEAIAP